MARLVLLDASALLMHFQFNVHLDAELRRVLGDVDVAVPSPVLDEQALLADLRGDVVELAVTL